MSVVGLIILVASLADVMTALLFVLAIAGIAVVTLKSQESQLLGNAVQVSDQQFAEVYHAARVAAERLYMRPPPVFIKAEDSLNAAAFGLLGNRTVILNSGIVEAMEPDELISVLGHEFSHIKCHHTTCAAFTGATHGLGVPYLSETLGFIFGFWSRHAEHTADRGALIASGSLDTTATALAKLATGKNLFQRFNLEQFLDQQRDISANELSKVSEMFQSHPSLVARIHALRRFALSPEYARIQESA